MRHKILEYCGMTVVKERTSGKEAGVYKSEAASKIQSLEKVYFT